jgi:hypothetical protein
MSTILLAETQRLTQSQVIGLSLAAVIVIGGLFVYGLGDLVRLSLVRVWAISSVVFSESIRRRVLWVAPLAMLGVIVVSQLQRSVDEQDAVRQTIKYCLFASGFLVVVAGIILSCTNLPRDIESKVVFTVVTKPATRLDIALGKIVGFARVSATILLIMGLFSYAYLFLLSSTLNRSVESRIASGQADEFQRNLLTHYQSEGLLQARQLETGGRMLTVARRSDEAVQVIGSGQIARVPFVVTDEQMTPNGITNVPPGSAGVSVMVRVGFEQVATPRPVIREEVQAPFIQPETPAGKPFGEAAMSVWISSLDGSDIVGSTMINNGKPLTVPDPSGQTALQFDLKPEQAAALAAVKRFYVSIAPANSNYLIRVDDDPVAMVVPAVPPAQPTTIRSAADFANPSQRVALQGRDGRFGQLIPGEDTATGTQTLAVYRFTNAGQPEIRDGKVWLQMRVGIESTADEQTETPAVRVLVADRKSAATAQTIRAIDNNKTFFVDLEPQAFASGNYDIQVTPVTKDLVIGLRDSSVAVVAKRNGFALNLAKSLFAQWMLSILVVTIGLFCSMFVGWPIAIVLSLLLLLGRWLVEQVRDTLAPGIGSMVATDVGVTNAAGAKVIDRTVEFLASTLTTVADYLPDISRFSTASFVERGVLLPWSQIASAAQVLAIFGVVLFVLSYVIFRNKEVAP